MTRRTLTRALRISPGDVLEGTESGAGYSNTARIRMLFVTAQTPIARDMADGDESAWTLESRDWRVVRRGGKRFMDRGAT